MGPHDGSGQGVGGVPHCPWCPAPFCTIGLRSAEGGERELPDSTARESVCECECVFMVSLLNLSVCHLFLWTWGSQGQGQEQWPEPGQDFLALVACTLFPALVLFQGMNGKLKKIKKKKKKNSTPILENSWGLKALNQGNILPSHLWTPLCLRAPQGLFPPLVIWSFLAQEIREG